MNRWETENFSFRKKYDDRFDRAYRLKKIFQLKFGHMPDEQELREFKEERDEKDQRSKAYWLQYVLNTASE